MPYVLKRCISSDKVVMVSTMVTEDYATLLPTIIPRLKRSTPIYHDRNPIMVVWPTDTVMYRDLQGNLLPVPIVHSNQLDNTHTPG
jgi:hypothetical protein